jgi:hypothetical protein
MLAHDRRSFELANEAQLVAAEKARDSRSTGSAPRNRESVRNVPQSHLKFQISKVETVPITLTSCWRRSNHGVGCKGRTFGLNCYEGTIMSPG